MKMILMPLVAEQGKLIQLNLVSPVGESTIDTADMEVFVNG